MQFDQPNMFPETAPTVPLNVDHMWNAHDKHFEPRGNRPELTYERMASLLARDGVASSKSTMERTRREYPHLFPMHWPLRREDVRPWLEAPWLLTLPRRQTGKEVSQHQNGKDQSVAQASYTPVALKAEDRMVHMLVMDDNGDPVKISAMVDPETGRVSSWFTKLVTLIGVGFAAAASFDMSDGRLDGAVHWCRVLAGVVGLHT